MPDDLLEKLIAINDEKITKIIPENIKKDVTILGVTGTLEEGGGGTMNNYSTTEQIIGTWINRKAIV